MPATDYQGSSSHFGSLVRLEIRRDQVHANQERELESFQKHVSDRFQDLANDHNFLSWRWICRLLDVFILCQEDFRMILLNHREIYSKSPMDRFMSEFYDKTVKALDICNAVRDGIEQIRLWQKHLDIVLCSLDLHQRSLSEGHFRRAKKALTEFAVSTLGERDTGSVLAQRNRSFGRTTTVRDHRSSRHFRSSSWSVPHSWSASRQLQAMSNMIAPRGNEILASNGLVIPLYTMNCVLLFVIWALVAALPCQDRGIQIQFSIPSKYSWASPMTLLYDRIMVESRRENRRSSNGLLKEIHQIELCACHINELADTVHFPLSEEKELETMKRVQELKDVYNVMKEGLDPLESKLREMFHRIVQSRKEGLDFLSRPQQ